MMESSFVGKKMYTASSTFLPSMLRFLCRERRTGNGKAREMLVLRITNGLDWETSTQAPYTTE